MRALAAAFVLGTVASFGCVRNTPPPAVEDSAPLCMDGLDNDDDGFIDCADQDCDAFTFCAGVCGDGILDPGEECDNGAGNGMGTCSIGCTIVAANCGNGVIDPGEQCDQGPMNSDTDPNRCRTNCQNPSCGDGVQDTAEECDDGVGNSDSTPDACRLDCMSAFCGDGVQDSGEGCDNGELNSDTAPDACRTNCEPYSCGDGVVDPMGGEGCDDGALNGVPGQCSVTCSPPGCGDGTYDPATEFCDAGMTGTNACTDFGYLGGTLGCTATCGPDVSGCNNCGNSIIDGVEDCDGAALGGATCMMVTGGPGTLGCNPDCTYDTSGCAGCGNGMIEGTEECDGLNLGGNDCTTVPGGYMGGTLSCDTSCLFDTSGCTGGVCDVDSPPEYTITPAIMYECADALLFGCPMPSPAGNCVWLDIGSFVFSDFGGMLHTAPVSAHFSDMSGPSTTCPSGTFTTVKQIAGGCCETYTLTGTYIDANTWTGTLSADFCQSTSCGCCDPGELGCTTPFPGCTAGSGCGDDDGFIGGSCDIGSCVSGSWPITGMR